MLTRPLRYALACALAPLCLAHEDDPKALDALPRYEGPGWLRSEGGPQPELFAASGVTLRSWLTVGELQPIATSANDCWGYVSASGREYAIIGTSDGTAFVEITDPDAATLVDLIVGPNSLWRDIKVYQDYAYAVSEGGSGIQVISLANLDGGDVTLVRTVTTSGTTATHNVAIDTVSGYLYRCGGSNNGLRIYSLADPSNPVWVANWSDRYVHDCQVKTFTEGPYAGRQIVFACSGFNGGFDQTGLDVIDVTNKSNIINVSRTLYPAPGYSHQGWLSPDGHYFYLDDELDEQDYGIPTTTRVIDVSDINSPTPVSTYTNGNTSIDHNLYTLNNLIYAANYRSGLRVFDASDPLAPVEVAYFDTDDTSDAPTFNGMWSNYPYFPSGTVIGSDIERGLFVFSVDILPLGFGFPDGLPARIDPAGQTLRVEIFSQNGGAVQLGTEMLHYGTDEGFESAPLTALGGGQYEASLPATACLDTLEYYVSAVAVGGQTVTSPFDAPAVTHSALAVAGETVSNVHDMESDSGWTVGAAGDDATTGIWTRVNPNGTDAQPEDDHTPAPGVQCWVTGQGSVGGGVGDNDVDNGQTTLTTPWLDVSVHADPLVGYWRWYSNHAGASPNADIFVIDISDGGPWVNVETIGPSGEGTSGGWMFHQLRVADFVSPAGQARLRFIASDEGSGSIVEAAIDDLQVSEFDCGAPCPQDLDGSGTVDLPDLSIQLANFGTASGATPEQGDVDNDGDVDLTDVALMLAAFGGACP